ncbi:MAG: outer membrane protein assembly factor BamA [Candidatus Marinimicrobia bacterium]|nr:outer membrane protein assembly factor BamA [Candidatus Neomarinimicrobiota bacterium]MCH8067921.1 outer membrane protein assembly factor BamA [Candidatus Neomarinimicrobiota bacterium]
MIFRKLLLSVVLVLIGGLLFAQTAKPIKILGVVVTGNNSTSTTVIKYTSGLMEGKEIIPGDFGLSVKKLWRTGLFSNIQIMLDKETDDGIYISIEVEENPVLGEIKLKGNKKKKWKDFEEELNLNIGQRLQLHHMKEAVAKMKELYAEDGYLRVEIEPELEDGKFEDVKNLIFYIKEHKKVKIKKIRFSGNKTYSDRKLRRQFKETKIQKWYLFWRSAFEMDKFEEDKIHLAQFYRNLGHKDYRILSDSISFSENGRKMYVNITVFEGPKYYLREFTWEGNTLYSEEKLFKRLNFHKGDVYDEEEFNKAVFEQVQSLYMDKGYIYSQITPQMTPVGEDSLDVHFMIVENNQVSVRKIDIAGNTKTRENVIRRELKIMPGDIFNRELLMRSARELFILNYFADVVPDVIPVEDDEVDLLINLEEKSSDKATASVGYNQQFGITGGIGFEFNNFAGKGQQLILSFNEGTQYRIGGKQPSKYRSISASFTDPMVNDTPNLIGLSAYYSLRGQDINFFSFPLDRELYGLSVRWGRRLKWPDNYFRGSWMVQGSRTLYKGSKEDLEEYVGGFKKTQGISITQFITRDSRNHPEYPSRGSVMRWTSTLSGGLLGGNENFQKHELRLEWYTPVVWEFALLSSLHMGSISELTSKDGGVSIIPIDEKYIMGGSGIPYGTMLRGYLDNTVGPYNSRPLGGNVMLKYTTELRFRFSKNPTVYGLVFAEMGNVWKSFSVADPFDLKRSAGFGIRMFMPMLGMIGFDMGYGFDDVLSTPESPEGWRFHILFGMPF